ncbi:MAG TPA: Bax inhibitor-1/YccA family protein [Gammaproteobacteria bacterium]|nr:Bax inhibitor-1/YccA family protein [Gammaproteobacteria bacterium]
MSKHAALDRFGRSGNPLIRSDLYQRVALDTEEVTTLDGAVNKTAILLALTVLTATISWNFQGPMMGLISGIGVAAAVISAFATFGFWMFRWIIKPTPHRAPYTAPIYAVGMGFAIGLISQQLESQFPGIVIQAVSLTFFVAASLLLLYKTGVIRPDQNFLLIMACATLGIFFTYIASFIYAMATGNSFSIITDTGLMGIGFSLVVVVIAALNLVLDFDIIEQAAETRAPKYMEWFGAMALIMTLIWLYLEILRLISKLRS